MQDLDFQQIAEAIQDAVAKNIPLSLSVQNGGWTCLHTRFVAIQDEHILVEPPITPDGAPYEFVPADKVALSFKLKHHKYLSHARVAGQARYTFDDGEPMPVLSLCYPPHMQRLQRRSFARVSVPAGKIVRVSFWPGGQEAEPTGPSDNTPLWSGIVQDISAGGMRALVHDDEPPAVEIGQTIGLHISFGPGESSICCDAQFRHCDQESGQPNPTWSLGFQFVGLAATPEGMKTMRQIGKKMSEFSRVERHGRRQRTTA